MTEEMVHIVDENDNVIDTVPRSEMRAKKLLHRAVYILVFNSQGEIFVHQRTFEKDLYPGFFDVKVAGTVTTESYDETAKRELEEEIGIKDAKPELLFKQRFITETNNVWANAYKLTTDHELKLQEEEIISGKFMSIDEIKELMKKEKFTPEGIIIFKRYLEDFK